MEPVPDHYIAGLRASGHTQAIMAQWRLKKTVKVELLQRIFDVPRNSRYTGKTECVG